MASDSAPVSTSPVMQSAPTAAGSSNVAAAAVAPVAAAAAVPKQGPPQAAAAATQARTAQTVAAPAAIRQQPQAVAAKPAAAAMQQPQASAVDLVIEEVLGGDLSMQERDRMADEMAYSYYSAVRESAGDQLDPETAAELNRLAAITQAEKDAILQKTNRVARKVLRPLGYKMLQVQGLNPATVDPVTARAALEADLTPQQQADVDAEAEQLFKQVYLPELQAAAADAALEDPDEAWEEFGRDILARQPEEPQQQSTAAIAVPAAFAGAVVALVVSKVFSWIQRRRQRRYEHSRSESYYEEEETVTGTDSAQDGASD